MGVAGLWDILRPAAKTRSLTELAVVEGFEANPDGLRGFRVGIDASIWFFHANYGKEGENPELRTLFFRCARLMRVPFLPLFVFDGPKRPQWKRGKRINPSSHKLTTGMKAIIESFGFEWRTAPGEAEAELAYLNRIGVIDGIISDDVDTFLFGATTVIRNPSHNLSGNRANPAKNSAGKDDKDHTMVYRLQDIIDRPDISLNRGGMVLIGLMSGGDYQQGGLNRCGTVTAHGLAKCGFGDSLFQAATNLTREQLPSFLSNWRNELRHELRTDSRGHIGRKQPSLAQSIPDDFPDINILLSYTNPITSETMGRAKDNLRLTWNREPDLGKLAATCEFNFEWGYKEAIIKRFTTVIWPPAVLRILRRAALNVDAKAECGSRALPVTPTKRSKTTSTPIGTPSKMITKHFSSMALNSPTLSHDDDDNDERLILKIHSTRKHVSTDGILEYRLEIAPAQLVRLAESGVQGIRRPEDTDEWAEEDDSVGSGGKRSGKKPPPDPESHIRIWMPASIVQIAEPGLVEQYEQMQHKRKGKTNARGRTRVASGKGKDGRKSAVVTEEDDESASDLPRIKLAVKAANKGKGIRKSAQSDTNNVRNDLKTTFAVAKPRQRSTGMLRASMTLKPDSFKPDFVELSDDSDALPEPWKLTQPPAPARRSSPEPIDIKQKERLTTPFGSDDSDDLLSAPIPLQFASSPRKSIERSTNPRRSAHKSNAEEMSSYRPETFEPRGFPTKKRSDCSRHSASESEAEETAPPTSPQPLRPEPRPRFENDDPFQDVPTSSLHFARLKTTRTKPTDSSESESSQGRLRKSPRYTRIGGKDEVNHDVRPGSPSPFRHRTSRAASSLRSMPQPDVIEISSDSDIPISSKQRYLPLVIAKARAQNKTELTSSRTSGKDHSLRTRLSKNAQRDAGPSNLKAGVIDLT